MRKGQLQRRVLAKQALADNRCVRRLPHWPGSGPGRAWGFKRLTTSVVHPPVCLIGSGPGRVEAKDEPGPLCVSLWVLRFSFFSRPFFVISSFVLSFSRLSMALAFARAYFGVAPQTSTVVSDTFLRHGRTGMFLRSSSGEQSRQPVPSARAHFIARFKP